MLSNVLGNWGYSNEQNEPSSCPHWSVHFSGGDREKIIPCIQKVPWRKKNKGKQRQRVFQRRCWNVRKGHFCGELNKGRETALLLYWRRTLEKCKGPEATAFWFCLKKNKEARWAKMVGGEIKKILGLGWEWGMGWDSMSCVRQLRRVSFYFEWNGKIRGLWGAEHDLTSVVQAPLTAVLSTDRKGPKTKAGRLIGDRCK